MFRRRVVERDVQRCAYVSASGRRCTATALLELHHVDPYAKGGEATVDNVCLLCASHNQYAADLDYGRALMQRLRRRPRGAREARLPWAPQPEQKPGPGRPPALTRHAGQRGYRLSAPSPSWSSNMPSRYSTIVPATAEAATVSGEARYRRPGPERPL
jgi:hypothetical protein